MAVVPVWPSRWFVGLYSSSPRWYHSAVLPKQAESRGSAQSQAEVEVSSQENAVQVGRQVENQAEAVHLSRGQEDRWQWQASQVAVVQCGRVVYKRRGRRGGRRYAGRPRNEGEVAAEPVESSQKQYSMQVLQYRYGRGETVRNGENGTSHGEPRQACRGRQK